MAIFFNARGDMFAELRNTSQHAVVLDGKRWPTVEHYVQAQRFKEADLQESIRRSDFGFVGRALARERPEALRADWREIRDGVMERAVREKFTSHEILGTRLCATGTEEIINASPFGTYWGAGMGGTGQNRLGRLIMQVRNELQKAAGYSSEVVLYAVG